MTRLTTLNLKLWRDLRRLWAQGLTIALVIASGVAAYVGSLSTHESLKDARDHYYAQARFADVFAAARRVPQSVAAEIARIEGVAEVQTGLSTVAQVSLPGIRRPLSATLLAERNGGPGANLNRLTLRKGRWIEPGTHQTLVHESFARAHRLEPGDRIGILLNGRRIELTVAGIALSPEYVFPVAAIGLADERSFGILWIDETLLASALGMVGSFSQVAVKLRAGGSLPDSLAALDRLLDRHGGTGAIARADQPSHRMLTDEIAQQRVMAFFLPAVFLLVAVYILNIVMSRQVTTQRDQIAVLKAIGYENRWIVGHYLELTALIVLLGNLIGLLLGKVYGSFMMRIYADFFRIPVFEHHVEWQVAALPLAINLAAGLAAALLATRSILQLSPAEAMRPPAPAHYRRSLIERTGAERLASPMTRMILRNLERRPLRALLALVGVAGSIAILISGTWWQDAIDQLLDVQFNRSDRAEVQVGFVEPVGTAALRDLARLPGVITVDGLRSASVRLHSGQASRRTALVGLPADSTLRRLIDHRSGAVVRPADALVLGRRLAEILDVRPGDRVDVESLTGHKRRESVRVERIVDELMGISAYAPPALIERLADHPDTLNWAGMTVAADQLPALFDRIRDLPRIATIAVKSELVRHFRETSARSILFFTGVLTAFASMIAIGVVYNTARIALAERAWELATLRVIGMTRGEVAKVLLGELALVVAVALPAGFLAGWALSRILVELMATEAFEVPLVIWPRTYAYAALTIAAVSALTALVINRRLQALDLIGVLKTRE